MAGGPVVCGFNKTLLVYILLIPVNKAILKGLEFKIYDSICNFDQQL